MGHISEYGSFDGLGLADLVRRRQVSPIELVDAAIDRIENLNPLLNAVIFKSYDEARQRANAPLTGPFAGVPFLLKDILGFKKGWPTRQGSAFVPAIRSPHDSTLVMRYEAAGVIALGKTNVPEFGLLPISESTLYGPARNPWNPRYSPGGSSGGAAAAVAAGIVPVAHANDGGGSIRIPASCCGLVGLKPTRGRTPLGPDFGDIMGGLLVQHVLTRTVRDSAAMLDATAGPSPGDPYHAPLPPSSYLDLIAAQPPRLRIAFSMTDPFGRAVHAQCRMAVKKAAMLCASVAHHVEEAAPPIQTDELVPSFMSIWAGGLASLIDSVARETATCPSVHDFEGLTWSLYQYGSTVSAAQYLAGWSALHRAARRIANWFEKYDIWLTSTLTRPPAEIGEFETVTTDWMAGYEPFIDYAPLTALQNATGQPAISLPLHRTPGGLPVGVQFVGRFGAEDLLLQLSAQIEQAHPWNGLRPAIQA
jgi:amidase